MNISFSSAPPAPPPHIVVVLGIPPVVGYDLVIPSQLMGDATDDDGGRLYDVRVAGLDGGPIPTESGYSILPGYDASTLAEADTVIVPGTRHPAVRREGRLSDDIAAALDLIRPGTRMVSICTGAFVLAAAELLDGRRATTHWAYADDLRRLYPQVELDENVLFTQDDSRPGGLFTSAGLSAGVDLCLHLLRLDHGAELANRRARMCVVPPWREGGQAQFIDTTLPIRPRTGSTAAVRDWAVAHLDHELDVAILARQAAMSVRTFTRRFQAETGTSPGAWLIQQRIRRAQRLLESSDLPVDQVAARAGLGSAASLRRHLRLQTGTSPSHYRRTFQGDPRAISGTVPD